MKDEDEYINNSFERVIADELDNQVGLDSSGFSIYQRHGRKVIRLSSTHDIPDDRSLPLDQYIDLIRDWRETGEAVANKLERNGFGEWYPNSVSDLHVELWEKTDE